MSSDTLTITDNRTGRQYQIPVENGTVRAMDLRQIKVSNDDFGLMSYDGDADRHCGRAVNLLP